MSIEAMKQALEALEAVYGESCDAIHALRTAIQQAESEPCKSFTGLRERHREGVDAELAEMEAENKPAGEPVAWIDLRDGDIVQLGDRLLSGGKTWRTVDLESNLIGRAYRAKQWWPMQRAYTHPAPGVPDGWVVVKRNAIESALQHVPYRGETWSALNAAMLTAARAQKGGAA